MNEDIKLQTETHRAEIQAYLDSEEREFAVGFQLMQKFSIKISIMHMIARKSTRPLMKEKLDYELGLIVKQDQIKVSPYFDSKVMEKVHPAMKSIVAEHQVKEEKVKGEDEVLDALDPEEKKKIDITLKDRLRIVAGKLEVDENNLPEEVSKLYEKARRFYHIYTHYHTQMKLVPEGEENNEARAKFLKLAKEYEELNKKAWSALDEWKAAGQPAPSKEDDKDQLPADVARALGTAKSYISRYDNTLDELEGKRYEDRKEKLSVRVKLLQEHGVDIPEPSVEVLKKHGIE